MPTIPFIFFEKANLRGILPLLERLKSHRDLTPLILKGFDYKEFSGEISEFNAPSGCEIIDVFSLVTGKPYIEKLNFDRIRVRRKSKSLAAALAADHVFNEEYWPIISEKFDLAVQGLREFCGQTQPKLVVLSDDTHYIQGRCAAIIIRQCLPNCTIIVLLASYYQRIVKAPLLGKGLADLYLVMNKATKIRLINRGVPNHAIRIVGHPEFSEDFRARKPLPEQRSFLFASQSRPCEDIILKDLCEIFRQLPPDHTLIVKAHPDQSPMPRLNGDLPLNVMVSDEGVLEKTLDQCCCVIAESSTALYHAICWNLPVIVVNYTGFPNEVFIPKEMESLITARNFVELQEKIGQVLRGALPVLAPESVVGDSERSCETIINILEKFSQH